MEITRKARERLDKLMDERRLDLGFTWRYVAVRAGLSYEAIRALRTGSGGIRSLTARKLDRALQWKPGSVERVLRGGNPVMSAVTPVQRALIEGAENALGGSVHTYGEKVRPREENGG